MNESQFYVALVAILTTTGGGLVAVMRWGFGRVVKGLDDNSVAMLANTASNAKLGEKIDNISRYVILREPTPRPGSISTEP